MKKIISVFLVVTLLLFSESMFSYCFAQDAGSDSIATFDLQKFLSGSGKLIPDVESNSILVIDYPANLEMVDQYLQMADVPGKQVLIEARVLEVKLDGEHTMGVNWEAIGQTLYKDLSSVDLDTLDVAQSLATGQDTMDIGYREFTTRQILPTIDGHYAPVSGDVVEPFNVGLFNEDIGVLLKVLTTTLDSKVLSAPKITTVSNRRARIDVLKTIPYVEDIDVETDTDTNTRTVTYQYSYTDEGVSMEVTPLVNPDNSITMQLFPMIKEIIRYRDLPGPSDVDIGLPETDVRVANTKVTVQSGQTLVIGGMIREKITDGEIKVPLIGDLPLVGKLFKSSYESKEKTELIILVSPKIITPKLVAHMQNEYSRALNRVQTNLAKNDKGYGDQDVFDIIDDLSSRVSELRDERMELEDDVNAAQEDIDELD